MPDHVTAYIAGSAVIDAQIEISDAGAVDESQLTPTKEMLENSNAVVLNYGPRFRLTLRLLPGRGWCCQSWFTSLLGQTEKRWKRKFRRRRIRLCPRWR